MASPPFRHFQEETENYYRKWLEQDVVYIIQAEEREVFEKLTTDEERDQFIEQFWRRRDSDPGTSENEARIEHYRRIQYANEHFHAGIPGWKTDRGRIYIKFGPPDRLNTYPAGGWYDRKSHEGGGSTAVYPFEVWEYRYLEGVGEDIELEFVDLSGANLYRLSMDPNEKDMFLHLPGMGLTSSEMLTGQKSFDRVAGIRNAGTTYDQGFLERAKDHPFQKAELLMKISKPPAIRYNDLRQLITASVLYDQLPFQVTTDSFRVNPRRLLVPVTISFRNSDISFDRQEHLWRSHIQVYGLVRTLTRKVAYEFDDDITSSADPDRLSQALGQTGAYQRKLVLEPGHYKLDLVLKDNVSGQFGTQSVSLKVEDSPSDRLHISSILLTRQIEPTPEEASRPFVFSGFKILPQIDARFQNTDYLGFYLEVYGFAVDQATQQPALRIEYGIAPPGKHPVRFHSVKRGFQAFTDRLTVARMIQLSDYPEGAYELFCRVTDLVSERVASRRVSFTIQ